MKRVPILLPRADDSKSSFASFAPSREISLQLGGLIFLPSIFLPIPISVDVVVGGFRTSTTPYAGTFGVGKSSPSKKQSQARSSSLALRVAQASC